MKPLSFIAGLCVAFVVSSGPAWAQETKAKTDKPNILVIWGDDIGWQNVSAYGTGPWGTPRRISTRSATKASSSQTTTRNPLAMTGDVQVITATLSMNDTKLVTGVRGKITF